MIHPEVGWEVFGGLRRSDITCPQEHGVAFVDERDEFVWEAVVLV